MGKFHQLSPELWLLIDVILCCYIELIFRGGVSSLPAGLLFLLVTGKRMCSKFWLNASLRLAEEQA